MFEWWIYALSGLSLLTLTLLFILFVSLRITVRYRLEQAGAMDDPAFLPTLEGLTNSPSQSITALKFYGEVTPIYEAMLEAIRSAHVSITMETYLFWSGRITDAFVEALKERARAGVQVKLLIDADGSRFLRRPTVAELREAGVEVRLFRPFLWYQPIQYNHRTHRKLLIIDGRIGFTGGIGISDIWFGPPEWLETMVRLEGRVVGLLQGAFFQNWVIAGGALNLGHDYFPHLPEGGVARGTVTASSPIWGDSMMRLLYYSAIASSRARCWLISPYFLPNWDTSAALAAAAARGVDVRVIAPGPVNDKALPYYASRRLYGPLLAAGVRIFEYQPAMMHAKAMIVDGRWTTIGSTNFDPRSFFLNSELNTSIEDTALAQELEAFFERSQADCQEITYEAWRGRSLWEHFLGWIGLLAKDQL